jgi:transposase-like protein
MNKTKRYSPEVRERAFRMVLEHQSEYESQWAAIESMAPSTYYEYKARQRDPDRRSARAKQGEA